MLFQLAANLSGCMTTTVAMPAMASLNIKTNLGNHLANLSSIAPQDTMNQPVQHQAATVNAHNVLPAAVAALILLEYVVDGMLPSVQRALRVVPPARTRHIAVCAILVSLVPSIRALAYLNALLVNIPPLVTPISIAIIVTQAA